MCVCDNDAPRGKDYAVIITPKDLGIDRLRRDREVWHDGNSSLTKDTRENPGSLCLRVEPVKRIQRITKGSGIGSSEVRSQTVFVVV
jgi:hypothetical protein